MINSFIKTTLIYIWFFMIILWWVWVYAITWPTWTPSWELKNWVIMQYFNKILVNTWSTSTWTVRMTEKVVNQDCWTWSFLQWFDTNWNKICINKFTYSWLVWTYGSCSASCWWWTQTRTVVCKRSDWLTVTDFFCPLPKPTVSRSCNTHDCCTYQCLWTETELRGCVYPGDFYYWYWAPCDCWCY